MSNSPQPEPAASRSVGRPPRPLPVLLVVDVSGSMAPNKFEDKVGVLNRCLAVMFADFARFDAPRGLIYTGVVVFGGESARVHLPFTPATEVSWTPLEAGGRTPMGDAFDRARELLEQPESLPAKPFRSAIVLVSDGVPNDEWEQPLADLLASERGAKALRIAVGIGTDITAEAEQVLERFATPGTDVLRADQVGELPGLFEWVTETVTRRFGAVPAVPPLDEMRF
jgi:uncharacterized protein YegL